MNEQQRQELQRIKFILMSITGLDDDDEEYLQDAYKALTRVLAEDALDKKADNARELGLSYDDAPAPVQESDELKHIGEQDFLFDVDERAWHLLVENRGGCRCHISPPCGACSNPISEEEMNEVGYTYTTPPATQPAQKPWVGLDEDEVEDCARGCANHAELARAIEAKLKEKNT
jgi:hypothetical protein